MKAEVKGLQDVLMKFNGDQKTFGLKPKEVEIVVNNFYAQLCDEMRSHNHHRFLIPNLGAFYFGIAKMKSLIKHFDNRDTSNENESFHNHILDMKRVVHNYNTLIEDESIQIPHRYLCSRKRHLKKKKKRDESKDNS